MLAPLSPLKASSDDSSTFVSDLSTDELEILSTYSGRSRNSTYSTVSQVSSGGTIAAMKFHSECDILSQHSVHIKASNSLNNISKNPSKRKRAKTLLKSMLPKLFKARKRSDVSTADEEVPTEFPILDLSEEPSVKQEGKHVYSHYYFDDKDDSHSSLTKNAASSSELLKKAMTTKECKYELIDTTTQVLDGLQIQSECSSNATCQYGSKSDVESGLGSQNLANTTSEDSLQLCDTYVQRSQSMKNQCSAPADNLHKNGSGRLSLRKLSQNVKPYLFYGLHQEGCDRVDTPSSGYGESQSGCCSIQSSLYSLTSNIPMDGASGTDFLCHHEGLHPCYHSSSLKRNSITSSSGRPQLKESKKSARSHSFNGKLTVHHE